MSAAPSRDADDTNPLILQTSRDSCLSLWRGGTGHGERGVWGQGTSRGEGEYGQGRGIVGQGTRRGTEGGAARGSNGEGGGRGEWE